MKRFAAILFALITCMNVLSSDWYGNKYSMFVHFGVYSSLGGVWRGQPVTRGYSEQIQACGGIYANEYLAVAEKFDPVDFDADAIVALAKSAGMRSIVFTSKHHDGFCMWGTATTDYNSVETAACGRDFIKELSEACKRGGINMGLYFSLIDWHIPYGHTMTTHNSDFILDEHHKYNLAQVTELLTRYGSISELWFDMGSLTPQQSSDLYNLVHELQPECKVSGRLGNDQYDFAVLGDNEYPGSTLATPWQSCASIFDETWGYRSWQVRENADAKAAEKLRLLLSVVSHGGNFLLNIGPDDKGGIVPYEAAVLKTVGRWLEKNADVVYDTECSPFRKNFEWGVVTRRGKRLNLILSGKKPADMTARIPDPDHNGKMLVFKLTDEMFENPCDIAVIRHDCKKEIDLVSPEYNAYKGGSLDVTTALPDYSYSCIDYYSNLQSNIAYNWYVKGRLPQTCSVTYTKQELGRDVQLLIDGQTMDVHLAAEGDRVETKASQTIVFQPVDTVIKSRILRDYHVERVLTAPGEGDYLFLIGGGNIVCVEVNGRKVVEHLNAYRVPYTSERVLLHLNAGENNVRITTSNRFEKNVRMTFAPCEEPLYVMHVPMKTKVGNHHVKLIATDVANIHQDCLLHNVRLY